MDLVYVLAIIHNFLARGRVLEQGINYEDAVAAPANVSIAVDLLVGETSTVKFMNTQRDQMAENMFKACTKFRS